VNQESTSAVKSPIIDYLDDLHARHTTLRDGQVATYIPELAKANPDWFGICLVTIEGHVYEVGDSRQEFTIQSISKPFVYGLALEDNTRAEVLKKISVEPTGDAFNAISLESGTGRPRNPMINAGAIAAAGLVAGKSPATRWRRMLEMFSLYTGREVGLDKPVYQSESATGHRNRAIGHMLRNFDILTEPPEPVVDLYFKQCSVSVTCRDLGVMAATLANSGVNPLTGRHAIRGEYVESILSVMGSCGMYDYAGEWLYRVGMPAKSGVAGGVIAVLPGQLGIGVFSPPLDSRGNSVRGLAVCDDISRSFDLHLFNTPNVIKSVIRLKFSAAQVNSNRVRTAEETEVLRTHGNQIQVLQLQGDLVLSTAEVVVFDLMNSLEKMDMVIIDFKHVISINESASRLFYHLLRKLEQRDKKIVFTNLTRVPPLSRYMKLKLKEQTNDLFTTFDDTDTALEFCENKLLARHVTVRSTEGGVEPVAYGLLADLSPDELAIVRAKLERRKFKAGDVIVESGTPAGEMYFMARGRASASIRLARGTKKRLGTFSSGMVFGEMGVLEHAPRSAEVAADTAVECDLLKVEDFDTLGESHPRIKLTIMRNMALLLSRNLRKRNQEFSVFNY
jgi:glutaminase